MKNKLEENKKIKRKKNKNVTQKDKSSDEEFSDEKIPSLKSNQKQFKLHQKTKSFKNIPIYISIFIFLLIFIFTKFNNSNIEPPTINDPHPKFKNLEHIDKIDDEEFNNIKNYIEICFNDNSNTRRFIKSKNPKISIIIPIYNGEKFIKRAICSIQNQDLTDIEIILLDDYSTDNSINIIKSLMKNDKRIILLKNDDNKGLLYTKISGILQAKGKYVMILDQEDLYVQKNAFSTLYDEAEKNNLYILGFASIISNENIKNDNLFVKRYSETPIIYTPYVERKMYVHTPNGAITRNGDYLSNFLFKKSSIVQSISYIKQYGLNYMNYIDDYILFFILTRNAYNLKQIKKIFHFILLRKDNNDKQLMYQENYIKKNQDYLRCSSYIYYIQFLLENTRDEKGDKDIASFEFDNLFLNHKCRNIANVKEQAEKVCKLYLENKYIDDEFKEKIRNYLKGKI